MASSIVAMLEDTKQTLIEHNVEPPYEAYLLRSQYEELLKELGDLPFYPCDDKLRIEVLGMKITILEDK